MTTYRTEISFAKDAGKTFLLMLIEDTITAEDQNTLEQDGWSLINNGTMFDDGMPAFAYEKYI